MSSRFPCNSVALGQVVTRRRDVLLRELRDYTRQHPQVIITPPAESMSRLWGVSLPRGATMAFDSLEMLLLALSMSSSPGDHEDPV